MIFGTIKDPSLLCPNPTALLQIVLNVEKNIQLEFSVRHQATGLGHETSWNHCLRQENRRDDLTKDTSFLVPNVTIIV